MTLFATRLHTVTGTRLARATTLALVFAAPLVAGAQQLTATERARIDSAAMDILRRTGAPSASIAIVRGGEVVHTGAYGTARQQPVTPAATGMRYSIGSVSKQFTAAAILLLAEEGKLSLDDRVSKWFPALTRAGEISIRNLLSMTSGYQDYWPHDYVFADMQRPAGEGEIIRRWAQKPLDFEPGTKWQYSNTNYVIAAEIVEKVSGTRFIDFLRQRIFTPLRMTSVADIDAGPLGTADAQRLLRHGVAQLREAPKEGAGWLFGAGQLAMTARDLATWNASMMNQTLLKPESYRVMMTDMLLTNGLPTRYGLGVNVSMVNGRRRISHGGAVSGFTTTNEIYPDDKVAITVFTNIYPGAAGASSQLTGRIANILFSGGASVTASAASTSAADQARRIYDGLRAGRIDRSLFTSNANSYFSDEVLADYAASLGALGTPTEFSATGEAIRGGLTLRFYRIRAGDMVLDLTTMTQPDGKIEQYVVARAG